MDYLFQSYLLLTGAASLRLTDRRNSAKSHALKTVGRCGLVETDRR